MWIRVAALAAIMAVAPTAAAQAQRVEVSGLFGWTLSDGVSGEAFVAPDFNIYDSVDVKDSASYGFSVGVNATPQVEVGFLFGQQLSEFSLEGTNKRPVGDLTVTTYHPYVAFNVGEIDARMRPYFMIGLGATHYGSVKYTRINGEAGETGGETQFSTTWGAGVKFFAAPNFGIRVGMQWTPTYIKSDPGGYWCDPYWGCYLVGDAQYSHQFQFNGGVTVRF